MPRAATFGDIYFNPEDGLAESRHVFLNGTDLPGRWLGRRFCTVGELGFGTGLNFLATWNLWRESKTGNQHLHFVSIEGMPLTVEQMAHAHSAFPQFEQLSLQLRDRLAPRARGHHLLHLASDVTLHLLYGDAEEMLQGLEAQIDTWFLDGFAPAKNPNMWSAHIMREVARCSAAGTRLATFTVAGDVRRNLQAAGFDVEKAPGFGRKRDMLKGQFAGSPTNESASWFVRPSPATGTRVAIVGGGIAGLSCARALIRQGYDVTVFEAGAKMGCEASGAPSGLVMPRLSAIADAPARFYAAAHRYAVRTYQDAGALSDGGALHLPPFPDDASRLEKMPTTGLFDPDRIALLNAHDASSCVGAAVGSPALYFEDAGQVEMTTYIEGCSREINVRCLSAAHRLERADDAWHLFGAAGDLLGEADVVIVANALESQNLLPFAEFPLEARYGQITKVTGAALRLPAAYGGYAAPCGDGLWIGATHDEQPPPPDLQYVPDADETNIKKFNSVFVSLSEKLSVTDRWIGTRASTPDQLPLAGPVCDARRYRKEFMPRTKGQIRNLPDASYLPGLYVAAGLGSRGFTSGPLLGEIIAAQVAGLPIPVDRAVRHTLHSARFLFRDLKRSDVRH